MSATLTLSERVNVLVATFVGIEAEQERLSIEKPASGNKRIGDLGVAAVATQLELEAIDDDTGNADLAAGLILLELMFQHDFAHLGRAVWRAEDKPALRALAALLDRTTGDVRRHAATMLAAAGIAVPSAATDPMLDVVTRHKAWLAAYAGAPFDGGDEEQAWTDAHPNAEGDRLHFDPPMPTTTAGAVAAVRFVMEDVDYIQAPHARILRQALSFLEGRAAA